VKKKKKEMQSSKKMPLCKKQENTLALSYVKLCTQIYTSIIQMMDKKKGKGNDCDIKTNVITIDYSHDSLACTSTNFDALKVEMVA